MCRQIDRDMGIGLVYVEIDKQIYRQMDGCVHKYKERWIDKLKNVNYNLLKDGCVHRYI